MHKNKKLLSYAEAIRDGMLISAKKNKSVIFLAEGITDPGKFFGTLENLQDVVSNERIIEMPISENSMVGVAIGAAIRGKRPIISLQRVEFALLAIEQIFNNAAKAHYLSVGKHKVPLVIRLIIGRGWGQGPEHSQSLESLFALIPGLKVIMPAFPQDAKGMIIAAIKDNNPVIVLEHRWCHYVKGMVKNSYFEIPLNEGPNKIKSGTQITIVATSYMSIIALKLALLLKKFNINIEVFDLRTIRPLKLDKIYKSVKKTNNLITIDTGFKEFGVGAEITSLVMTHCFKFLKNAPIRMGLPSHPTPSSRGYIDSVYIKQIDILHSVNSILNISKYKLDVIIKYLKKEETVNDKPNEKFTGPF